MRRDAIARPITAICNRNIDDFWLFLTTFANDMTSIQLFDDDLDIAGVPAPATISAPAAPLEPATILVVASQEAAQDGSYQALVSQLSIKGRVEMQMVDRIIEGGESMISVLSREIRREMIR